MYIDTAVTFAGVEMGIIEEGFPVVCPYTSALIQL